jgi:hypothetical protein
MLANACSCGGVAARMGRAAGLIDPTIEQRRLEVYDEYRQTGQAPVAARFLEIRSLVVEQ